MTTEFHIDKEALAKAAEDLRVAMLEFKKKVDGFHEGRVIDAALAKLNPILDLCISKELEEPFDFIGYMGKVMGDDLGFPEIRVPYESLVDAALGGIPVLAIERTEFHRRMPRQLRRPPEYEPSPEEQERIKADLKLKHGG